MTVKPSRRTSRSPFLLTARRTAERLRAERSASTVANYLTALRSMESFLTDQAMADAPLSRRLVADYDQWLAARGVSANTRSCYLRSLRALHNAAGSRRRQDDTFSAVFTGNASTRKRAVSLKAVRRIRSLRNYATGRLRLAADVFMFSLYAMGMPFADAASLRWSDISSGRIEYRRSKTGVRVSVWLEPCMREILGRWRGTNGGYVFPLVPHDTPCGEWARAYAAALGRYNRDLGRIGKRVGMGVRLSSYAARHTWATLAHGGGMRLADIAEAMGHRSTQATVVYIKNGGNKRIESANRRLIAAINGDEIS